MASGTESLVINSSGEKCQFLLRSECLFIFAKRPLKDAKRHGGKCSRTTVHNRKMSISPYEVVMKHLQQQQWFSFDCRQNLETENGLNLQKDWDEWTYSLYVSLAIKTALINILIFTMDQITPHVRCSDESAVNDHPILCLPSSLPWFSGPRLSCSGSLLTCVIIGRICFYWWSCKITLSELSN